MNANRSWIARQPILDRKGETYGYELLYRSDRTNAAVVDDPTQASAKAMLTAFTEIGLEELCGGRAKAVFRLDHELMRSDALEALPRHRVLFRVAPREGDVETLRQLSSDGFRLVLPAEDPSIDEVLDAAEIATLDVQAADFAERAAAVKKRGVRLLAKRVETHDDHERALEAGCDLVQGFFFRMPQMVSATHVPASHQAVLKLLAKVQSEDTPLSEIERLITADASLGYRLLRLLGSARFSTAHRVDSVRRAVVMLGRKRLAKWVSLIALSGLDDRPAALLEQSILRARMCEVVGASFPDRAPSAFFTVGLFSCLDAMLGRPLELILSGIALTPEVEDALLREKGVLGSVLSAVIDYESGEWRAVDLALVEPQQLADAYFDAARYSLEMMSELGR